MDVGYRYIEQIHTTVETMRRRCLAIYDGTVRLGQRSSRVAEKLREVCEPIAYDIKEAVTTAVQDTSGLDATDRDTRNTLLELYLGCSVLAVGLSAGEISGIFVLNYVFEKIFDKAWELLLMFLLPYYVYMTFRKNAALDETERRVNLFGLALCIGAITGHLVGTRLISAMPAAVFIQPLLLGLAVDIELSPQSVYSNRKMLLGVGTTSGAILAILLVSLQGVSFCAFINTILQAAFLAFHFQMVIYAITNKMYGGSEAQLGYILATLTLHVLAAGIFGSSMSPNAA